MEAIFETKFAADVALIGDLVVKVDSTLNDSRTRCLTCWWSHDLNSRNSPNFTFQYTVVAVCLKAGLETSTWTVVCCSVLGRNKHSRNGSSHSCNIFDGQSLPWLGTSLSVWKDLSSIPSRSNRSQCRQRLAAAATFFRSCVVLALSRGNGSLHLLHASA